MARCVSAVVSNLDYNLRYMSSYCTIRVGHLPEYQQGSKAEANVNCSQSVAREVKFVASFCSRGFDWLPPHLSRLSHPTGPRFDMSAKILD